MIVFSENIGYSELNSHQRSMRRDQRREGKTVDVVFNNGCNEITEICENQMRACRCKRIKPGETTAQVLGGKVPAELSVSQKTISFPGTAPKLFKPDQFSHVRGIGAYE